MTRRLARRALPLVLCSLLLAAPAAHAIGLGALDVASSHGEPLRADVELVSVSEKDLASVRASLADVATYDRFGVPRPDVLSSVAVSVATGESGQPVIRISSREPVHELYLNVLLEIDSREARLTREVIVILDPFVTHGVPATESVSDGAADTDASSRAVYTVAAGDSLMRIAQRLAPSSTSVEQTAVALYEANPEAFLGSIHRLIVGARLSVPAEAAIRAHSPQAASAVIRDSIEDFRRRRSGAEPGTREATRRHGQAARDEELADEPADGEPGEAAGPAALFMALPVEDDLVLRDFQAVMTNIQGGLYDLQGTLDERIEQLDSLHSQIDELIDERGRIRDGAGRGAPPPPPAAMRTETPTTLPGTALAADAQAAYVRPDEAGADIGKDAPASNAPIRPERYVLPGFEKPALDARWLESPPDIGMPAGRALPDESETIEGERSAAEPIGVDEPEPGAADVARHPASVAQGDRSGSRPIGETTTMAAETAGAAADEVPEGPGESDGRQEIASPGEADEVFAEGGDRDGGAADASALDEASALAGTFAETFDRTLREWIPRSDRSLEKTMQILRDGGLIVLALCMIHLLLGRRFGKGGSGEGSDGRGGVGVGPDGALDLYIRQLPDKRMKEELLKSVLADSPERQDLRLQLLCLYAESGATSPFVDEAQTMYRMTEGKAPEWHHVVEMGLKLDDGIDFYKAVVDDDPFDLNLEGLGLSEEDRVSSVPAGTDVRGGGSGTLSEPDDLFEGFTSLHNTVARSEEGELFTEEAEAASSGGEGSSAPGAGTDDAAAPPGDGTGDGGHAAPVPLAQRPVYVPDDARELIEISVNYHYGVEKLDFDLGEGAHGLAAPELDMSGLDAPAASAEEAAEEGFAHAAAFIGEGDDGAAYPVDEIGTGLDGDGPDGKLAAAGGVIEYAPEPDARPGDVATGPAGTDLPEGADPEAAIADEHPVIDLDFHTESIDLKLGLAETYVDNGYFDEARRLIEEALPWADVAQRQRAQELLERIGGSHTSDLAYG